LTLCSQYVIIGIMKRDFWSGIRPLGHKTLLVSLKEFEMSCIHNEILLENLYEEALELCTKRMCVIGSFPWEIKAAAEEMAIEMFEERIA
jgi:hypothetical protein